MSYISTAMYDTEPSTRFPKELILENTPHDVLSSRRSDIWAFHLTATEDAVDGIMREGLNNKSGNLDGTAVISSGSVEDNAKLIDNTSHDNARYVVILKLPGGNFNLDDPDTFTRLPDNVRRRVENRVNNGYGSLANSLGSKANCFLDNVDDSSNRTKLPAEYIVGFIDKETGLFVSREDYLKIHRSSQSVKNTGVDGISPNTIIRRILPPENDGVQGKARRWAPGNK